MRYNNSNPRYKWVVLLSSSLTCSLTWGLAYTIGVFYVSWIDEFDAGNGELAVIGGINTGVSCLLGPVYELMHNRMGYRRAGALGGVLISTGYIGSSLSTSVTVLCLFYGVIMGVGFGLAYYCASLSVNIYFIQQRTLAEGMVTLGSGVGGFGFTVLAQYLIDKYGWRGAMLIIGAISAHVILLFQLMFYPDQLASLHLDWNSKGVLQEEIGTETKVASNPEDEESEVTLMVQNKEIEIESTQETRSWKIRYKNMFKNPVFLLMLFAEFFCWTGIYVPFVHLTERARLLGINIITIAWIASSISLSMCFGRLIIPALCNLLKINPFYAYGLGNGISGLVTVLSPFLTTETGLLCYAILFGFSNVSVPLIRASAANLLGASTFPMAYGWVIFVNGIGLFIGPAVAGLLYDVTQSYDIPFYTAGACLIISGLLTTLRNPAMKMHKKIIKKDADVL